MPKNTSGPDQGRVKVRIIEIEADGQNPTLVEAMKTLSAALTRSNGAQTMKAVRTATNGSTAAALNAGADQVDEVDADDDTDTIEHEVPAAPRQRAKRAVSSPEILDLDLASGEMPLKKFIEEKKPEGDYKRYLVIAYWFKNYASTPAVTVNHIHTAYRYLGWSTPKNAAQPLRDLKSKNQWFGKGASAGEYAINHVGENVVNEMH